MANNKKYKGSLNLDWINKDQSLYYEIDEKEGKGVRPVWVPKNDIRVAEPRILRFIKDYGDNFELIIYGNEYRLILSSLYIKEYTLFKDYDYIFLKNGNRQDETILD